MDIRDLNAPLRVDDAGTVRVGDTNVLFELVVRSYKDGHVPEEIAGFRYTTLDLGDTYGAIAYYHQHKEQVEEFLNECDREAAAIKKKIEEAGFGGDADDVLPRRRAAKTSQ